MAALQQNWDHARHVELARDRWLALFSAALAAILTFVLKQEAGFSDMLATYWPLALLVTIIAVLLYPTILKTNLEFANHVSAAQWISERLALNTYDKHDATRFVGYMALPIPPPAVC